MIKITKLSFQNLCRVYTCSIAGLTTRYRTENLYKSIFLSPRSHNVLFVYVKRIESLLRSASKKFEFENLESRFHNI